jgi:hypothetical protein
VGSIWQQQEDPIGERYKYFNVSVKKKDSILFSGSASVTATLCKLPYSGVHNVGLAVTLQGLKDLSTPFSIDGITCQLIFK